MTEQTIQALLARIAQLERIIEITRSLNSTLSRQPLLDLIIDTGRELTGSEGCSIMLLDRQTGELHFEAATGARSEELRKVIVPMEGTIAGWVAQHGEPLTIHDTSSDPRFTGLVDDQIEFKTNSMIAVPLAVKGKLIGVLESVNKEGGESFSESDVDTLIALADQAAVAIENSILFEQSDLVAEIVHEIRTPLTSIMGYAGMIQRGDVEPGAKLDCSTRIQQEAKRLSEMTDDFLELARLESGRAFLSRESLSLSALADDAIELLRSQADQKQISMACEFEDDLPDISGDRQRLRQVFINLLSNAIKYCLPGDRVTVSGQANGQKVFVCVADTGPGIPEDAQEHIFEKFYRVEQTEEKAVGTGLGLAITRQIVESHGGEIWLESEEGEGSRFCVALPIR